MALKRPELNLINSTDAILLGSESIVSFPGRSQYTPGGGGVSACGLAAMNFARIILSMFRQDEFDGRDLLSILQKQETSEDILSICARWSGPSHLDVDDIFQASIFQKTLSLIWQEYERPGLMQFQHLLRRLQGTDPKCAVAIITRPPEIIAVSKLSCEGTDVFVIFDSHPRTKHPQGSGLIFNTSVDAAAHHLADLLQYDPRLLEDSSLQWQAQLLANYSAHVFVGSSKTLDTQDWLDTVLDSSLAILALRAEMAQLEERNRYLQSENERLDDDINRLEGELGSLREAQRRSHNQSLTKQALPPAYVNSTSTSKGKQPMRHEPIPDARPLPTPPVSPVQQRGSESHVTTQTSSLMPIQYKEDDDNGWRIPESEWVMTPDTFHSNTTTVWQSTHEAAPLVLKRSQSSKDPWGLDKDGDNNNSEEDGENNFAHNHDKHIGTPPDLAYVLQKQREFDEEDRLLRSQQQELQQTTPDTFNCGICLEDESEYMVSRFELCGHLFCRDCVRDYVKSKIGEHRFPILCPTCTADKNTTSPGSLNSVFIEQIGLSEKEANDFVELELATFSTLLHCRSCEGQAFVDKEEYQEARIVACPLPGCRYVWCKTCSQAIDVGGPAHSCDGTSELNHLMNSQGWKYCPGCRTPTEKSSGCNHMTCMSPGCNMHFCYICGAAIVQSVLRSDIQREVSAHYRQCRLFEDVPDRPGRRR